MARIELPGFPSPHRERIWITRIHLQLANAFSNDSRIAAVALFFEPFGRPGPGVPSPGLMGYFLAILAAPIKTAPAVGAVTFRTDVRVTRTFTVDVPGFGVK